MKLENKIFQLKEHIRYFKEKLANPKSRNVMEWDRLIKDFTERLHKLEAEYLFNLKGQLRYYVKMSSKEPNLIDWHSCINETLTKLKKLSNEKAN